MTNVENHLKLELINSDILQFKHVNNNIDSIFLNPNEQ